MDNLDLLISSSLSDIIVWSVDKGTIIKEIKFANKWNYLLYKESIYSVLVLSDLQDSSSTMKLTAYNLITED